jgi:DNA helicase-2/ATP-dependent DNA helicase PcrA
MHTCSRPGERVFTSDSSLEQNHRRYARRALIYSSTMSNIAKSDQPQARASEPVAPYLATLNAVQREAVETTDGPLLVLAGAGTGKTRVLTSRLAHILLTGRAWPGQILAVTFTNRAAREMRERVAGLIGDAVDGLWIGTFHALAARILRRHAELVGLKSNFTILDADDQIRLIKQLMAAADIDDKRWPARALHGVIERFKDRGLTPDKVGAADVGDYADGKVLELYRQYQDRLKLLNACDFGDLLLHNLELFTANAHVLAKYQDRFHYMLVDEYQDTNVAQYLWLRLLAQKRHNLCCVGDDDQSIYSWRGAEIANILKFEKDFTDARVVRLEQNYRSTKDILAAASGLIEQNSGRLGKTLWTEQEGGNPVAIRGVWDGESEARMVCETVETLQRRKVSLENMAVLVRASFQMREFEERFITLGLAYRVVGGPRFYERQEIRDAIAYMRLIHQPDDDLAFERIVNLPPRGIGPATLQTVHILARAQMIPLSQAARRIVETDELKPRARKALNAFNADCARWRTMAQTLDHVELTENILDESGYTAKWRNDKSPDAPGRLENLRELVSGLEEFDNLAGFLEHISLVMDRDNAGHEAALSLMTLHAAKGLEFDHVFLPGWEEEVFPNRRSVDEGGSAALEEERRLAYVGLTRAKQQAYISFAANRRIYNQWLSCIPSRFVDELPKEHVEITSEEGLYGAKTGHDTDDVSPEWPNIRHGRGPGYARMQNARHDRSGTVIEGRAKLIEKTPSHIQIGVRVFHQKFGYGTVQSVDGEKLEIEFEKAGNKKVMDSFVEPT